MKAIPYRRDPILGLVRCEPHLATELRIRLSGPTGFVHLPVMIGGTREGTGNWTWNGDTEKPTLRPSLLTTGTYPATDEEIELIMMKVKVEPKPFTCHVWVNDGMVEYLNDSTHEFAGKTLPLLDIEP